MDLERWKLFLLVGELGSLSKAAVVLGRPQPVISRHITALEEQCCCSLFYRTGRGVALTEIGLAIEPRIRALIDDGDQILADIKGQAGTPTGRVSVGLLPSIPIAIELGRRAAELYPDVELHLTEMSGGQLGEQVATGRVDLALLLKDMHGTAAGEPLVRLPMCLAGPPDHPLCKAGKIPLSRLEEVSLIMARPPNTLRLVLDQAARKSGVALDFAMQVDPLSIQRKLVMDGQGLTVTTRSAVRDAVEEGRISAASFTDPGLEVQMVLMRSNQRPATLAIRKIATLLSELVRRLPERYAGDDQPSYVSISAPHDGLRE